MNLRRFGLNADSSLARWATYYGKAMAVVKKCWADPLLLAQRKQLPFCYTVFMLPP